MMPFFVPIYFGSHVGDVDIGALFILLGVIGLLTAAFSSCYDSYPSATLTSAFQFKEEEVVPEEEKRLNRQQWRYAVPMILLFALTVVEGIYSLKNSMAGAMVACLCQIIMLFSCGFALSTKHIQRYRVIDKDTYDAEYPANTTRHVEVTCGFVGLICAIGAVVMYGIQYFNPELLGQTSPEMLLVYFLQSLCFLVWALAHIKRRMKPRQGLPAQRLPAGPQQLLLGRKLQRAENRPRRNRRLRPQRPVSMTTSLKRRWTPPARRKATRCIFAQSVEIPRKRT